MTSWWDSRSKTEAERFWKELKERLEKFHLELHPEKTRLLEFGRFAARTTTAARRREAGNVRLSGVHAYLREDPEGKVYGLTADDPKAHAGQAAGVKIELRRRMHDSHPGSGHWLRAVVGGHFRYYGVPTNSAALSTFRYQVGRYWHHAVPAQSARLCAWERMNRLLHRWLPRPASVTLILRARARHHLRQEPDEGKLQVRICAGGYGQP